MIHIVTAVSRPENLPRIHRSIELSISRSNLRVKWIIVSDSQEIPSPEIEEKLQSSTFEIQKVLHPSGHCLYGISQKNLGIDSIESGFFHCLDDDNLVHPLFFSGLERAMKASPSKRAFVVGQQRWDSLRALPASPDRMNYGQIDNTMFVVHSSLIGKIRYDLKQSGREDFIFFNKLWSLYREEFVFVPETLSYYNYIRYFPAESPQEPIRQLLLDIPEVVRKPHPSPISKATLGPPPAKPKGVLRIALYSSKRDRCGISTYASHLEETLISLGHDVRHFGSHPPYEKTFSEVYDWKPDIFHFQHETSIMPPEDDLRRCSDRLRSLGSKVFITLHTENPETIRIGRKAVLDDFRIVMHRPTQDAPGATIIPMPCTNLGVQANRSALRKKFGFPEDAFLISTVGFMIPWKDHPRIVEVMIPWLSERKDVHIQIIASEHFSPDLKTYSQICKTQLSSIASAFHGRVRHVDHYPGDLELVERLAASDLGYVWCPFDTGSSSAAAAQFTTARCPLVATDSTHYAYLGTGIVRSPKDVKAFVDLIQRTAENSDLLGELRSNQWDMYRTRNYIETARKHLELYGKSGD